MKVNDQRIAIAQHLGWTNCRPSTIREVEWGGKPRDVTGTPPAYRNGGYRKSLPKYTTDLNAIAEAEKSLDSSKNTIPDDAGFCSEIDDYITNLEWIVAETTDLDSIYARTLMATAEQRSKAFLKTIGKWEEENET